MSVEADRALRFSAEVTRLKGAVERFITFSANAMHEGKAGEEVRRMLLEGITVQDALERVAKIATRTEVVP